MTDDDLPDRLRRLIDRSVPVRMDEVTGRPVPPSGLRRARPALVLGVVSVIGLLAAVALLRVEGDDAPPAVTEPSTTTQPAPSTTGPTTTVPATTVPAASSAPTEFAGVTEDGRLVVVDVDPGDIVRELARLGDPAVPATPDRPIPPNVITFVEVVPGSPSQVLYTSCCEPATGEVFGIGFDGSPTTLPVDLAMAAGAFLFYGDFPDVNGGGIVAVTLPSGGGAFSTFPLEDPSAQEFHDLETDGAAGGPAWIDDETVAYVTFPGDTGSHLRVVPLADPTATLQWDAPEEAAWTNPVGLDGQVLVAEQCCGDRNFPDQYETAIARLIDPTTGEVTRSFPYDGIVVDQDVSASGHLLVTFADGRVASVDPSTGDSTVLATGFTAASW